MRKLTAALLCVSISAIAAFAHGNDRHFGNQQDITVRTTKVSGSVYMLQGRGGNIAALTGSDGILIVDDDYKVVGEKLREALTKLGSPTPKFILNTHWHSDHTEGNELFGKSGMIVAHTNVRKRLLDPPMVFGQRMAPYVSHALPVVTYSETMSLHVNGEEVRLVHYPNGHTDGDSVVYFVNSKVVHLGDHFFVGRFPFIDLASGGSVQGFIANIETLIRTIPADHKLIPGHGPLATVEDLKAFHQLIVETAAIVQDAMKAGQSFEEIKATGLPEKYKEAGSGFIKTELWLEILHQSYSAK